MLHLPRLSTVRRWFAFSTIGAAMLLYLSNIQFLIHHWNSSTLLLSSQHSTEESDGMSNAVPSMLQKFESGDFCWF